MFFQTQKTSEIKSQSAMSGKKFYYEIDIDRKSNVQQNKSCIIGMAGFIETSCLIARGRTSCSHSEWGFAFCRHYLDVLFLPAGGRHYRTRRAKI
jgi:hypothetical protein